MGKYMRAALVAAALLAVPITPAQAFPGENGKLAFSRPGGLGGTGCLYTANPDGSGEAPVTPCADHPGNTPHWSPDGNWIGFIGYYDQVDAIKADGTNYNPFVFDSGGITRGFSFSPATASFSPIAGAYDVVMNGGDQFGISIDNVTDVTGPDTTPYAEPDWSPDGSRLVFAEGVGSYYQLY